MKTLKFKLFLYKAKGIAISIINLVAILILAYFFDKLTEMLIFTLTYNVIRKDFTLAVHGNDFTSSYSKAVKICRLITFIIQTLSIVFLISVDVSRYFNIAAAIILGFINFLVKYYLERNISIEAKLRNPETLRAMCEAVNLSRDAANRMYMRYLEKKSIREIADIECVEEETIKQSIRRSRRKLNLNTD